MAFQQDREIASQSADALTAIENAVTAASDGSAEALTAIENAVTAASDGSAEALMAIEGEVTLVGNRSVDALAAIQDAVQANTEALRPRLQTNQLVGWLVYSGTEASLVVFHVAGIGKFGEPVLRHIPTAAAFEEWGCRWESVIVLDSLTRVLLDPVIGDPYDHQLDVSPCQP